MENNSPNIIIILADDLGYSDLGCYGSEIKTPNIDKLANKGIKFSQFYNQARCSPSRASLMTGLTGHQAGVGQLSGDLGAPGYRGFINNNCVTIAEVVKQEGYDTYLSGKWHLGGSWDPREKDKWQAGTDNHPLPTQRGFDDFYGIMDAASSFFRPESLMDGNKFIDVDDPDYYFTDAMSDRACEMIEGSMSKNNPFFLIIIFLFSIYFIMLSWGINVTAWIASAGILSVVIGFAAKDTLGNLFSGIFIMADSPYKEGDYINLDTGERGYVRDIGIRSTRIQTRDDIEIIIPNSVIANSKIINESGGPHEKERIRITVDVAYGSVIEDVKNIMDNIAKSSNSVCQDPAPRVRFREFGESGIKFQLLAWIEKPELRGRVIDELSTEIYNSFNSNNIEIPFPQRTIHIKKTD